MSGLFPEPQRAERAAPAQAMRARWQAAVDHGQHPLAVALRCSIPLHPDASRDIDGSGPGPRCGGCRFRVASNRGTARTFPKCSVDGDARVTGGPGTDVRKTWPACGRFDPASPDRPRIV